MSARKLPARDARGRFLPKAQPAPAYIVAAVPVVEPETVQASPEPRPVALMPARQAKSRLSLWARVRHAIAFYFDPNVGGVRGRGMPWQA